MTTSIHERLKYARLNAGFSSARAFARTHDIPYVTYSQHESGKRNLSPEIILKYSDYMDVTAAWLLTGTTDNSKAQNAVSSNYETQQNAKHNAQIDADLFADIYIEIAKTLNEQKMIIPDRTKITICVNFYHLIQTSKKDQGSNSKFDLLNMLCTTLKSFRNKDVT